ncbi:MAG: DMT family transporter [Campylobacter sp.]|nr:DMT family transporter [Campylobacter sp.]
MNSYRFGVIITFLSGIFWSFSGLCGEYLFTHKNISPEWINSSRLLLSGAIMMTVVLCKDRLNTFEIFKNPKDTLILIFFGGVGISICHYTYYLSIHASNAAIATVFQYTSTAMIIVYVALRTLKFPKFKEIIGLISTMIGVFFLATNGDIHSLVLSPKAIIMGLISAMCVAIYALAPISINKKYGVVHCLALALMIGGINSVLMTKFWRFDGVSDMSGFLALFVGIVLFGTIGAFWLFMEGVKIIGAPRASLIAAVEPVSSAILGHFWFGTKFTFIDIMGFACILFCVVLLARK